MVTKWRWLVWFVPLLFLGLLLGVVWRQDSDFWRSIATLSTEAQEAARRGDYPRALELARKARSRQPHDIGHGVLLGYISLKAGQPQAALEVGRQVAAQDPQAAAAVDLQAQALDLLGEPQEALSLLSGYLQDHPDDPEILATAARIASNRPDDRPLAVVYYRRLYQLGQDPLVRRHLLDLLVSLDRFAEAIPLQEEEVAQFPEIPESLHRLALLYYWQRDYQAAAQIYQRLTEQAATDAALRLEAAKAADTARDTDQALAHYLWLYARHQGKKEYALALARLWAQKGNHGEAAAVLAPLMREEPDPELRRWYALELLVIGDFAQARQQYLTLWEHGDTHQETIINLARLYGRQQQFAKAAAFWDEAARRQLLTGDLRWEAALGYSYARRFEDALEVLKPLYRQDPQNSRLLLFSGQLHFYLQQWGRAARYFTAYLEKNPQDVDVRQQLAEALSFQPEGREAALNQYGEVLKQKDEVGLRLRRITLLLKERRWEDAARELHACPAPTDPRLIREQAHLLMWLGDLEAALPQYDRFLQHSPHDPAARLEKARVLLYLGRAPEALEMLNRLRMELPRDRTVRVAAIEAYLATADFPKALALAQKELEPLPDLGPEDRALVARCYYHSPDPQHLRRAAALLLNNLHQQRYHHPSLLIMAAVLPRLPRYEDLDHIMDRFPGVRVGSPESAAALAFFDGRLGRHGGKLDYLLHVVHEYRQHRRPDSPGELLGLAWLATELGDQRTAAAYYRQALHLRPSDQNIARLLKQCRLARKDYGQVLASLEHEPDNPGAPLEMARLYLLRGQYEGVKAMVAKVPENSPDYSQALFLLAQAYRMEHSYPETLQTLTKVENRIPRSQWLMERARTLEAMDDRGAVGVYEEIIRMGPDSQEARVARARQARARRNWAAAQQAYGQALEHAPQDVELLNELEAVRREQRPQLASRGFPDYRGQRRPEEAQRPWQFSRFGREPLGLGLTNYLPAFLSDVLPIVQPESLFFTDSNSLYGGIFRISGGFWITKVLPARVGLEYREYNQTLHRLRPEDIGPGADIGTLGPLLNTLDDKNSRLRRAEFSLGLGPAAIGDRLRISGEIIGRRYWKRVDRYVANLSRTLVPFPIPHIITSTNITGVTEKEDRNRLLGSLELGVNLGLRTDAMLRYSRRDIFDQEAYLFPRLYQTVLDLAKANIVTYQQVDLALSHQFRPGLDWRGYVGGAFFSDTNRRLTLYQGLTWQAVHQPRMHLEFTPHYYFAGYRQRQEAYFSPHAYHAFGLGLDFDRQIFRLPTLILQGTVQAVGQHGDWGPALQGLAALEWEFVQNFYTDIHFFYFREWVDNYRLLTAGVSCRWRF